MHDGNPLVLKLSQSGLLTEEDHAILIEATRHARSFSAETILIEQETGLEAVPLVMSGIAYCYRLLRGGGRQILALLLPGDFDVQGTLLGRSDHSMATLTDCQIVHVSRGAMDQLTLAPTRIARALWWSTLVDKSILQAWLTNMGRQEVSRQLAHFLSEFYLRMQIVGQADANGCRVPLRQDQLADILGVTRVHVSRTLSDLREQGLLDLGGRRLTVPDVAKLWAYCEFDPSYLHLAKRDLIPAA